MVHWCLADAEHQLHHGLALISFMDPVHRMINWAIKDEAQPSPPPHRTNSKILPTAPYSSTMSWKDDPFGVPLWSERPRCRCGFRAWMVTIMDRSDRNYGRRCFKCPDLDNDFMVRSSHYTLIVSKFSNHISFIP